MLHVAVNLLLLAGVIIFALCATSNNPLWVAVGRVGYLSCAAAVVLCAVLWTDPNATIDLPFDRTSGILRITHPNSAGDSTFFCMTHRSIYEGGYCVGTVSHYWYRNADEAKVGSAPKGTFGLGRAYMLEGEKVIR